MCSVTVFSCILPVKPVGGAVTELPVELHDCRRGANILKDIWDQTEGETMIWGFESYNEIEEQI